MLGSIRVGRMLRPHSPRMAGRLAAVFLVGGGLVGMSGAALPGPSDMSRLGVVAVGLSAMTAGAVAWLLPWDRLPWWASLSPLVVSLTLLSLSNVFSGYAPYSYGIFYVVIYVWLGISFPSGAPTLTLPLLAVSYLVPMAPLPGDVGTDASSLALVVPTCVMVGELLAWGHGRLMGTEERLRAYSLELEQANRAIVQQDQELRTVLEDLRRVEGERRTLLERTVDALEEERTRIAIELHDGPIQHLTALDYMLETVRARLEAANTRAVVDSLARAQELARDDVQALRHLMTGLRPPALDEHGLGSALTDYAASMSASSGVACSVDVEVSGRLDPTVETVLYRIAQEALTNVAKHAGASRVDVLVRESDGDVQLDVTDDGVGMWRERARELSDVGHYGLMAMRQRAEMVGGSCEILAAPGGGTWVHAIVPLRPRDRRPGDRSPAVGIGSVSRT